MAIILTLARSLVRTEHWQALAVSSTGVAFERSGELSNVPIKVSRRNGD